MTGALTLNMTFHPASDAAAMSDPGVNDAAEASEYTGTDGSFIGLEFGAREEGLIEDDFTMDAQNPLRAQMTFEGYPIRNELFVPSTDKARASSRSGPDEIVSLLLQADEELLKGGTGSLEVLCEKCARGRSAADAIPAIIAEVPKTIRELSGDMYERLRHRLFYRYETGRIETGSLDPREQERVAQDWLADELVGILFNHPWREHLFDEHLRDVFIACTKDPDPFVRRVAIRNLFELFHDATGDYRQIDRGGPYVIPIFSALFERFCFERDPDVRGEILKCIALDLWYRNEMNADGLFRYTHAAHDEITEADCREIFFSVSGAFSPSVQKLLRAQAKLARMFGSSAGSSRKTN